MKKAAIYSLLFTLSFVLSSSSLVKKEETNSFQKQMMQVDRAFIPVLYYVQKRNMVGAQREVISLTHEWNKFSNRFASSKPFSDWQLSFNKVDHWMSELCERVDANQVKWSLAALSHIQYELSDLRCRYHIPYYFDYLYAFEDSWGTVRDIAEDQMMCRYEWNEFEFFVAAANRDWAIAEQEYMPADLLNMTDQELFISTIRREELTKLLRDFKVVLNCGDQGLLQTKTKEIEDAYFEFLRSFGRFANNTTHLSEVF